MYVFDGTTDYKNNNHKLATAESRPESDSLRAENSLDTLWLFLYWLWFYEVKFDHNGN